MRTPPLYCPECGKPAFMPVSAKEWRCAGCQTRFFHNVAGTVAGVICCGDEVLFAVRGEEPAKGLLDFPGGFVDPDETLEQALARELQEELQWSPDVTPLYLFSGCNTYHFAGVTYKTVDVFFRIECVQKPVFTTGDDVAAVVWEQLETLEPDRLAFDVMREAVIKLRELKK